MNCNPVLIQLETGASGKRGFRFQRRSVLSQMCPSRPERCAIPESLTRAEPPVAGFRRWYSRSASDVRCVQADEAPVVPIRIWRHALNRDPPASAEEVVACQAAPQSQIIPGNCCTNGPEGAGGKWQCARTSLPPRGAHEIAACANGFDEAALIRDLRLRKPRTRGVRSNR